MEPAGDRPPLRAVLYARVSTKDQDPETQLQDLRRYASARGFEVVDAGISGAKDRRPGLKGSAWAARPGSTTGIGSSPSVRPAGASGPSPRSWGSHGGPSSGPSKAA